MAQVTRRHLLAGALCGANLANPARLRAACANTEEDRLVWARERMYPSAPKSQLQLVYQWLTNATHSCSESGDLWYYRALTAKVLGNTPDANYCLGKAEEMGSRAKAEKFNPFMPPPVTAPRRISDTPEKWALIVGIKDFPNIKEPLDFSVKDAQAFYDFLTTAGGYKASNVTLLLNQDATSSRIRDAFGNIRVNAQEKDLVVVYFSSHGSPRNLDPTGLSYVLTYDTLSSQDASKMWSTGLRMVELAEFGRWTKAEKFVLLLDTCYSGAAGLGVVTNAAGDGLDSLTGALHGLQGSGNRIVIAASKASERSYEDQDNQHGYFTYYLLEALKKKMSMAAAYAYLKERVSGDVEQKESQQQHPVMQDFGAGGNISIVA